MKEFKEFVTEYYKTIGSVVVILAMVIACAVTLIQKRTANTDVMAKMISITPLYEDNITTPEIDRITYYAANIDGGNGEQVGIRENVGAYSDGRKLTEQQQKDKFALESLLASNTREEVTVASEARRRRKEYKINALGSVNNSVSVTLNSNASASSSGGTATAQYASTANGTYLGQFLLTGYCACVICCGKTNGITASGRKAVANHTIAADRRFAFGTQMIINGIVYTVDDRGGAITGNHIDIYFNTHAEALQFGRRTGDVYLYTGGPTTTTTVADNTSNTTTTNETVSDDPNSTPEENESNNTSSSNSVTLIGDSLTVGATSAFQSLVPSANIDGKVGRQMLAGSGIVSEMKAAGTLGDTVIIELGTNGPFSEEDGQRLIDSIGSDKRIFWMNTYGPSLSWYSQVNATISALCNNNSNVTLINWEQMGLANPGYFAGDGIHLTSAGYQAYAQLMANAIK